MVGAQMTNNTETMNEMERTSALLRKRAIEANRIAERDALVERLTEIGFPVAMLQNPSLEGQFAQRSQKAEFCVVRGKMTSGEDKYQQTFEAEVTAKLRDGWRLHGHTTVLSMGVTGWFYVTQAMVKG